MPARTGSAPRLISQSDTGRLNRTRLLQILYDLGPRSRADLARIAGVAKTTIGSIVQPMIDAGILVEGEPQRSSAQGGKPARPLWFSPAGRPIIAVHVLPNNVYAALVSPTGTILARASGTYSGTRNSAETIVERIVTCIKGITPTDGGEGDRDTGVRRDRDVLGVGVAVGGIVNTDEGTIVEMNLAPRLSGLPLGPILSRRLGLAVHLDLHPRVQAIGDRWFGSGRRKSSFASLYCAEAIGVGVVIGGDVHRGTAGAGGEVGHTIVDLGGAVCQCGRAGCWETIASHRWLRSRAAALGLAGARSMTVKSLSRLVADGVPGADQLLQEFARNVAVGIINLQQTLAPGLFIVHGEIVTGGEQLRALISQQVLQGVAHHPGGDPVIEFATEPDDTVLLGAAGLVLSESLELLN